MSTQTLVDESVRQHGFYVPQFEVRIEGVGLPRGVLRDVVQATYKDNIKEIDSLELTINNWEAATRRFKYVGDETAEDLKGSTRDSERYRLFDPCNKQVELWMGYAGDLRLMIKGTFTTLEPTFTSGSAPTLAVRGLNALHQLRRKQYSHTWNDKRDSEIAKDIATLTDKDLGKGHKRFPVPVVIDQRALAREEKLPYVAQKNQYDIDFLMARALRLGYVVYLREADPTSTNPDARKPHLYFGPSDSRLPGRRDVEFKLRWGASLTEFKPTLTTANQVKAVTVNGWDRTKKKAITARASLEDKDKELNVNTDLYTLLNVCDPREELVVDKPVHSEKEAKQLAQAILKDRQKEMVKASGATVGLPDLRAGRKVQIEGLGVRFNGTYFVTDTTHTVNDGGYTTRFNARREQTGLLEGLQ
jgi:phage protein D